MAIQEAGHHIKGFNACKSPSGYVPIVWTRRGQEQGLQRGTRPCEWDLRGKAPLEAHDMSVIRSKPLCGHVPIVWTRRGQEQGLREVGRSGDPRGWPPYQGLQSLQITFWVCTNRLDKERPRAGPSKRDQTLRVGLRGKAPLEAHDMSVIRSKPLCGHVPIVWTRRGQEQGLREVGRSGDPRGWPPYQGLQSLQITFWVCTNRLDKERPRAGPSKRDQTLRVGLEGQSAVGGP